MGILALAPRGRVLPFIHSSMVRSFRTLGIKTINLSLPEFSNQWPSIRERSVDFQAVFILDMGCDPIFMKTLKDCQVSLGIPWLIWFLDDPEGYGFPESCSAESTIPFCWDREVARAHNHCRFWHGAGMEYLPLASDPTMFRPEEHPPLLFAEGVFVGSPGHRNSFLEEVVQTNPGIPDEVERIWSDYGGNLRLFPQDMAWERLSLRLNKARQTSWEGCG